MFEILFGPKNPTKDWQRALDSRLTFDLDCAKLNGVGFGDRLDRLAFLGPVEDRDGLRAGEYRYFSLGLSVSYRRQFPEKEYASHKVRIISAVDRRKWP